MKRIFDRCNFCSGIQWRRRFQALYILTFFSSVPAWIYHHHHYLHSKPWVKSPRPRKDVSPLSYVGEFFPGYECLSPTTGLYAIRSQQTKLQEECQEFMENHIEEQEAVLKRDRKIYLIPVIAAIVAFSFFVEISHFFHLLIETLSQGRYKGELSDEIRPLINGPVTLTISILFGSLVNLTMSNLYGRQAQIHQVGIATMNEVRHIKYLAEGLPEPQRSEVNSAVDIFAIQRLRTFFRGDMYAKENRNQHLTPVLLILHQVGRDPKANGPYLGELYTSLANLKQIWVDFSAATQKNFTPAHYVNLMSQAVALLLIYLWETDDADLLETHTFELRVAFAMLMLTMASIAAIIIDLSTPISNIITMVRNYNLDMDEILYFGLAKDMNETPYPIFTNGATVPRNETFF